MVKVAGFLQDGDGDAAEVVVRGKMAALARRERFETRELVRQQVMPY